MGKLTVSYDGDKIINTSQDGSFTLATKDKVLTDNVDIQFDGDGWSDEEVFEHKYAAAPFTFNGTFLYPFAFAGAPITEFHAPNLIRFTDAGNDSTYGNGSYVFSGCTNLVTVDIPNIQNAGNGGYQFYKCTALLSIHIQNTFCGQHMFDGCTSLQVAVMPYGHAADTGGAMNGSGFNGCGKLTIADLGSISKVHTYEFNGCGALKTLIIRRSTAVPTLSNINAFNTSPFASGKSGGTLYVPQALIESYQAATNWSTILGYTNNQILPLEGSEYENTYADGTPVVQEGTT